MMEKSHLLFVTCLLVSPSSASQVCQRISVTRHVLKLPSSSPPPFLGLRPLSPTSPLPPQNSSPFSSPHFPFFSGPSSSSPNSSSSSSSSFSSSASSSSSSSVILVNDETTDTKNAVVPSSSSPSNQSKTFAAHTSGSHTLKSKPLHSTFPPLFSTVSSTPSGSSIPKSLFPFRAHAHPSSSSASTLSSFSSSSSSSSSVCWTSGGKGRTISVTPDHRGNLWVLTTSTVGSHLIPNAVWVLNFTSMTWNDLGYPSARTDEVKDKSPGASPPSSSSSEPPRPTATTVEVESHKPSPTPTVLQPAVFCSWVKGLVLIYTHRGFCQIWLLPYSTGQWVKLKAFPGLKSPSEVLSVDASWCGRLQDSLWLLTTNRQTSGKDKFEVPLKAADDGGSSGGHRQTSQQTLWKLDHQGKWSPLDVDTGRDKSLLPSHNTRTWTDNQGGLFILYEKVESENGVDIVRFDKTSGTRTIVNVESSHQETLWIPNTAGRIYSIYSGPDGNRWIKTSDYYTGEVISIDSFDTPIRTDILVRIDGTIYSNIPYCDGMSVLGKPVVPNVHRTVIELHRFSPAVGCSNSTSIINYQYTIYDEVTMLHQSRNIPTAREEVTNHRVSNTRAVFGEAPPEIGATKLEEGEEEVEEGGVEREAEMVFTKVPPSHEEMIEETGLSRASSVGKNIIVSDIEEVLGGTKPPTGPHQRDKNRTNDSVIFFSLSLSIFALVGIVIFVRRCVRCPPAAELGETGVGDIRGKPPSPLPVLYSIVPDDPAYDTNVTDSPCPSYSAIYEVPTPGEETPNGGTPNFMTPNMNTPMGDTPYSMTPNATTPTNASPQTFARHDNIMFSREVTYAITNSATNAINIATNNAFKNHYVNTTQF